MVNANATAAVAFVILCMPIIGNFIFLIFLFLLGILTFISKLEFGILPYIHDLKITFLSIP